MTRPTLTCLVFVLALSGPLRATEPELEPVLEWTLRTGSPPSPMEAPFAQELGLKPPVQMKACRSLLVTPTRRYECYVLGNAGRDLMLLGEEHIDYQNVDQGWSVNWLTSSDGKLMITVRFPPAGPVSHPPASQYANEFSRIKDFFLSTVVKERSTGRPSTGP